MSAVASLQQVPLSQLRLSATLSQRERRQHFDKGAIADLAAARLLKSLDHNTKKRLFKALDWPVKKAKGYNGVELELPTKIADLDDAGLAQLTRDLAFATDLTTWTFSMNKPGHLEAAAADLGIDAKEIRAELAAAAKEKAKVKKAKRKFVELLAEFAEAEPA